MAHYTLTIDGKEWTVGSKESPYDAAHAVAGALLAGAEEITIEKRDRPRFFHTDEDIKERIEQLQEWLDEDQGVDA